MRFEALLACVLMAAPSAALAQSISRPTLEIVAAGQPSPVASVHEDAAEFWLQQLTLSALYRDAITTASVDEWAEQLAARSRLHLVYPTTATLAAPGRRVLEIDEVLVPLTRTYPDYVFVRHGDQVLRLAKYDPWVFRKLMTEAEPALAASLPVVERGLF